jgi:Uma2 family endonuclease
MITASGAFALDLRPVMDLNDDQFYDLCRANHELRFERTAEGEILIMAPTGGETGRRNARLTYTLMQWSDRDGTGIVFDSSTALKLPDGSTKSPDASWIKRERWDKLTGAQKQKFSPICPDFVIELRSATDSVAELQEKMREYIANGAQLGWLIDPQERRAYVYRPNAEVETLDNAETLAGEPVLAGFVLDLKEIR